MLAIGELIQQAFVGSRDVGIPGAAVPDVALRILALLEDAVVAIVAAHADEAGLDAGLFLKSLGNRGHMGLVAAAVHHQLAALAGAPVDLLGHGGHAAYDQDQSQEHNQNLLHFSSLLLLIFRDGSTVP